MNFDYFSNKIVFSALRHIGHGRINLINYDQKKYKFGHEIDSLNVNVKVNRPGLMKNIIKKGSVGLAESYINGDFETNNLQDLIEIAAKNINIVHKFSGIFDFRVFNLIKNFFVKNTRKRSKKNIAKHYDLGNEFFSLWLDKTLTYSSAIFDEKMDDLELAQINKYRKLSDLVKPKPGDKMLEIGCGWGGYAEYIGKNYDVKLDCITISKKQYNFAKERIYKKGLNEKINIQMLD